MAIIQGGSSTAGAANVNATYQLQVGVSDESTTNGILAVAGRCDDGAATGDIRDIPPEVDEDFRWRVSVDSLRYSENFAGAALNSGKWSSNVTTMTTAVGAGYLTLNSGSNAAINTVARVTSYATIPVMQDFQTCLSIPIQVAAASVGIANTTWEVGAFIATGTAAPTDGIFLRMNAIGELRLVANFNGTETQSAAISLTRLPVNQDVQLLLIVGSNVAQAWLDDVLVAALDQPIAQPTFTVGQQLPISFRIYNAGVAPASATQLKIGPMTVSVQGQVNAPESAEVRAISGLGAYQGQSGGTMGSTANYVNSTVPATATLSNTAAGYTTLGGNFLFAAPVGAETDYALFGYQVPAIASASGNTGLLISGIRIDSVNVGAAVATTATCIQWGIAVGSTAVSLATAEGAATVAPRRLALGVQSWTVGAAIGAPAEAIALTLNEPLYAPPGTFVHVICRVFVGTATASQIIRGCVTINARNI